MPGTLRANIQKKKKEEETLTLTLMRRAIRRIYTLSLNLCVHSLKVIKTV